MKYIKYDQIILAMSTLRSTPTSHVARQEWRNQPEPKSQWFLRHAAQRKDPHLKVFWMVCKSRPRCAKKRPNSSNLPEDCRARLHQFFSTRSGGTELSRSTSGTKTVVSVAYKTLNLYSRKPGPYNLSLCWRHESQPCWDLVALELRHWISDDSGGLYTLFVALTCPKINLWNILVRQLNLPTRKKPGFLDSRNGLHVWQGRESSVFQGSPTGAMLPYGARFFSRNGSCSKRLAARYLALDRHPPRDLLLNQLSTVKWGRFNHSSAW